MLLLAAALVAVLAAAGGVVLLHSRDQGPVQAAAPGAQVPQAVRDLGWVTTVGGPLADQDFVTGVRERVADLAPSGGTPDANRLAASNVVVLWAGDVEQTRAALVGYPPETASPQGNFTLALLTGATGARPAQLSFGRPDAVARISDVMELDLRHGQTAPPVISTVAAPDGDIQPAAALALVVAPAAHRVQVATERQYLPGGGTRDVWRTLPRASGVVWVTALSPAERVLNELQVDDQQQDLSSSAFEYTDPAIASGLRAVAGPGTDPGQLKQVIADLSGSGMATPVAALVASARLDDDDLLTAGVLRSPQGGYLIAWDLLQSPGGSATQTHDRSSVPGQPSSPADVMGAIQLGVELHPQGALPFAVLAPAGAVLVRAGSATAPVTAPVTGRLSVLHLQGAGFSSLDGTTIGFDALDGAGHVIGHTTVTGHF